MPLQKLRAIDNRHNTSYKGKAIDTSQASTSKFKMSYGKKSYSSFKINVPTYNERRRNAWETNFQASTCRNPSITCYYCGLVGHVKLECRKRINDLKTQSYQLNKKNIKKEKSYE